MCGLLDLRIIVIQKNKQTTSFLSRYKKKTFEKLNDWILAVLGAAAFFLIAGYLGPVLGAVVPTFLEITNELAYP